MRYKHYKNANVDVSEFALGTWGLDDSRWKSSEKERFMNQVLPFLTKIENNFYSSLNECTSLLNKANISYQTLDTNVKNTVEQVTDATSIDVL